jgi:beta-N-acetylhexosaminidase
VQADVRALVQAGDVAGVESAVEETLRIDDPFVSNRRRTTREVELGGQRIPAGSRVLLNWTAANRDPAVFVDPDRYDPTDDESRVTGATTADRGRRRPMAAVYPRCVPTLPALVRLLAALIAAALLTTSCTDESAGRADEGGQAGGSSSGAADSEQRAPSETPLPWGPSEAEIVQAKAIVRNMSAAELAGQVIVGRWHGTDPATAATMVEELHLAGVQLTGDNIVDRGQVSATTAAVTSAFERTGREFPPVIGVDQEGGSVAHLRGVTADFPSFATAGAVVAQQGSDGRRTVRAAMRAKALELRELGFTWLFAPVADVTIGEADVTIRSRSASSDPRIAAGAVGAAVKGYVDAGLVSTAKHFPGHGSATQDSHETLPEIDVTRQELAARDLPPFRAAVRAGAPAVMMGHLDVTSLAPGVPTSLAPEAYDLLRDDLGFDGVAITDSLGMGAVLSPGRRPAVDALAAGADLLLMPADTAHTHGVVARAIRRGELSRERVEEAATRVVAVQMWQQRIGEERPVPGDASERAAAAGRELVASAP